MKRKHTETYITRPRYYAGLEFSTVKSDAVKIVTSRVAFQNKPKTNKIKLVIRSCYFALLIALLHKQVKLVSVKREQFQAHPH